MNSKKVFYIMIGLIALFGLLAIGGTVLGNNQLQKNADKLVELKLENHLLEAQQTALIKAKKDIETNQELEQIAKTVVPQEKDQARTVRELINIANAAGVPIASITFPTSDLGAKPKAAPKTPDDETGESAADTEAETPTPTAPAAPPLSQVQPVQGIKGVYQLEVTVTSDSTRPVPYDQFIRFLEMLEQNRRTAQVTNITVTPSEDIPGSVTFNLIVNVFIKP